MSLNTADLSRVTDIALSLFGYAINRTSITIAQQYNLMPVSGCSRQPDDSSNNINSYTITEYILKIGTRCDLEIQKTFQVASNQT